MSEPPSQPKTNCILVTWDASSRGRAALDAAVRLASELSLELRGLFVEDENLLRLARLPFAREVDYTSGASRSLQSMSVERTLRAAAAEAERALAQVAQQFNIRWSFQVARGAVAPETLATTTEVDLLIVGQEGCLRLRQVRTAVTCAPVLAVFDGTASGYKALEMAAKLVHGAERPLVLFVAPTSANGLDALRKECETWLRQRGVTADVRELPAGSRELSSVAKQQRASVLIINQASHWMDRATVDELVKQTDCPIVIVR